MQLTPCSKGQGKDDERGRDNIVWLVFWTKVCEEVREQERMWGSESARPQAWACSTENRTKERIPAASVADKLQGLAGTSGAQVALSIQDRAHWSVVWAGAGANSWTLALSAPH